MYILESRAILHIAGVNSEKFLQRLITADISNISNGEFKFSALLNPQSRFLYDFFIYKENEDFQIEVARNRATDLRKTLKKYDLFEEIIITIDPDKVYIVVEEDFLHNWKNGFFEGRKRVVSLPVNTKSELEYHLERIKLALPEGALELTPEKSLILEYGYEEAGAVSFNKGCYVGQELITRTKRVGEVRKKLYCIYIMNDKFFSGEKFDEIRILSIYKEYALIICKKERVDAGRILIKDKYYNVL